MPQKLMDCIAKVKGVKNKYAVCANSTGWIRKTGGGWRNKKTGKTYKGK